jgi:hypothetical protein
MFFSIIAVEEEVLELIALRFVYDRNLSNRHQLERTCIPAAIRLVLWSVERYCQFVTDGGADVAGGPTAGGLGSMVDAWASGSVAFSGSA